MRPDERERRGEPEQQGRSDRDAVGEFSGRVVAIAFQGGLTGSLFLEFAITLAAAVVVSGIVAITLSPVMSMKFVHPHGEEGRLTRLVNRAFDVVRRAYARLLDGALAIRWAVAVSALIRVSSVR